MDSSLNPFPLVECKLWLIDKDITVCGLSCASGKTYVFRCGMKVSLPDHGVKLQGKCGQASNNKRSREQDSSKEERPAVGRGWHRVFIQLAGGILAAILCRNLWPFTAEYVRPF